MASSRTVPKAVLRWIRAKAGVGSPCGCPADTAKRKADADSLKAKQEADRQHQELQDKERAARLKVSMSKVDLSGLRKVAQRDRQDADLLDRERAVKGRELSRRERRQDGYDAEATEPVAGLTSADFEPAKLGMTVRELYALKQPETLIENLLAVEDVTILSAKPKVGKTNLLVGLLAENLNRGTWLGEAAKELRCVYLGEEHGDRFGRRLRDAQVSEDTARARLAYVDAKSLKDSPTWQEKLERVRVYIDAMSERPNLLVIDTLGFWAGLTDVNDYATVSKEFKPVLDFAFDKSIAVLVVHHSRKGNGTDIDSISGSNALTGGAGNVALLTYIDGNDTQRKLTVWSRDVGEYELIVNYNSATHYYDKPHPMDTLPEEHREILELLEAYPDGVTVAGLGGAYIEVNGLEQGHGLGDRKMRTILTALGRKGMARQDGGKDSSGKKVAAKWIANQPQK